MADLTLEELRCFSLKEKKKILSVKREIISGSVYDKTSFSLTMFFKKILRPGHKF